MGLPKKSPENLPRRKPVDKFDFIICPKNHAGKHLYSHSRSHLFTWIISIGDPYQKYPAGYFSHQAKKLRLEFDDITEEEKGYTLPQETHIQQLIDFAPEIRDLDGKGLIHCTIGRHRSTAAAIIVSSIIYNDDDRAIQKVFEVRPVADPNRLMLRIADRLLNRQLEAKTNAFMAAGFQSQIHSDSPSTK